MKENYAQSMEILAPLFPLAITAKTVYNFKMQANMYYKYLQCFILT